MARRITTEAIAAVCRLVAAGRKQRAVALELGESKGHVQNCLTAARSQLALHTQETAWIDTSARTAVEVAQAWLAAFPGPTPAA